MQRSVEFSVYPCCEKMRKCVWGEHQGCGWAATCYTDYENDSGTQSAISAETRNRAPVTEERATEDPLV